MTEGEMVALLRRRYGRRYSGNGRGPMYVHAAHVRDQPFDAHPVDFLAMETSGYNGHRLHGHEIKVSRGDWLRELANPDKCETWRPFVHFWWLVVADRGMVRDGELPAGWGMLAPAPNGRGLQVVVPSPRLSPEQLPWSAVASFIRRAAAQMAPVAAAADGWAQAR
jgi:hypothetical protein